MGALRACYTTTARLTRGGPLVRLVWYWAEPGAPIFRGWHVFAPVLLVEDKYDVPDTVGEVPYARRKFRDGSNPFGYPASGQCGTAEDFLGQGTPPTLPNGRPDFDRWCGCDYRATIGFGCGHTVRHFYRSELKLEAEFHGDVYYTRKAELLLECEWNDLSIIGLHERAELLLEAEWNATFFRDGDWIHTESGGMTWTEYTPLDVQWSAEASANCGGTNGNRQQGSGHRTLTLSEDTDVKFTLTGRAERQNAGYDLGELVIDGAFAGGVGGTDEGLECTMGDVTATVGVTLSAGDHEIEWRADTVDENYHVGAFWRLTIELGYAVEVAELLLEAEWNEREDTTEDEVGELLLEAEWNEGDPPEGSWPAELLLEAEWNEIT